MCVSGLSLLGEQADQWDLDAIHEALTGPNRKLMQGGTGDVAAVCLAESLPPAENIHRASVARTHWYLEPGALLMFCKLSFLAHVEYTMRR